jgi:hypothetical protein
VKKPKVAITRVGTPGKAKPGKKHTGPVKRTAIAGGAAGHGKPKPPKKKHESAAVRAKLHKAAVQAAKTRKHNAAKHHKKVKLALGDEVSCCAAEALAASLRLAGWTVTDADVLELYRHTASYDDEGASIEGTLRAASEYGLAGIRPVSWECVKPAIGITGFAHPLVLGLELPGGPHALTLDPSGAVWSWGELYDLAQLEPGPVEQAWLVDWRP